MYTAVKAIATASVFAIITVQPSADAARSPYSVSPELMNQELSSPMFNPYADSMAGVFQPRDDVFEGMPNLFVLQPPVAMIVPEPAQPRKLLEFPTIERFEPEVPADVVPPPPAAEVGEPDTQVSPQTEIQVAPRTETQAAPQAEIQAAPQPVPPVPDVVPPPAISIPLPKLREAIVVPPAPKAQPRELPALRAAGPAPRTNLIAFDGPAGAPFAHTRFCLKYPTECRVTKQKIKFRGGAIELTAARRLDLTRINADVNRAIIPTEMNEPVAQEQWLISPKLGDCNDYAVTKRHKLIASGWPARALLLAEVVVPNGEHHLVLVIRTRQGDMVADNLNANLRDWNKAPYEWVRIESPVNPLFWSKLKSQPNVMAMNTNDRRL